LLAKPKPDSEGNVTQHTFGELSLCQSYPSGVTPTSKRTQLSRKLAKQHRRKFVTDLVLDVPAVAMLSEAPNLVEWAVSRRQFVELSRDQFRERVV
jgi:hypothetical protein